MSPDRTRNVQVVSYTVLPYNFLNRLRIKCDILLGHVTKHVTEHVMGTIVIFGIYGTVRPKLGGMISRYCSSYYFFRCSVN